MIHILDSHSANQIAAGEVVERPASLVKELAENAIDAGATRIEITVEGNGVPLIRVRDDGCGIQAVDLPLAVIRHATSKIEGLEDLDHLRTLGFRGEALASIASVSQLEIVSRPREEAAGLCLAVSPGEEGVLSDVGCPAGTCVTVRNLFFNTPARLKFLKSSATEFGLISDVIGRLALANPGVAFQLTHPKQTVLQTSGRGDLREAIGNILGHSVARQLIPLKVQDEQRQLQGFISPPDVVRSTKQNQIFILNGRNIRSPFLSRALEEGYHTLIPAKLHPLVVMLLQVSPEEYDVNVHPTKMDVRFKNEKELAPFISRAVYRTLLASKPLPSFQTPEKDRPKESAYQKERAYQGELPGFNGGVLIAEKAKKTYSFPADSPGVRPQAENELLTQELKKSPVTRLEKEGSPTVAEQLPEKRAAAVENWVGEEPESEDVLARVWPLAQLFQTYILATDGKVFLMIDQHAAHERINYEELFAEFKQKEQASQMLLLPLPLEFTLQEEQVVLENLWLLTEMGFILEQFGDRTYLLRGVPVHRGTVPADRLLHQFIESVLQKNVQPTLDHLLEEWVYLLACKASIKGQEALSLLEMEQLIARLRQTDNPYTCPHGRPTMVKMTRGEVERRFYRT